MNDFSWLLGKKSRACDAMPRALTHDVFRADDLVQDTP
jgi:DNA-directed RNA polymerase specialized sigma24 family protein